MRKSLIFGHLNQLLKIATFFDRWRHFKDLAQLIEVLTQTDTPPISQNVKLIFFLPNLTHSLYDITPHTTAKHQNGQKVADFQMQMFRF